MEQFETGPTLKANIEAATSLLQRLSDLAEPLERAAQMIGQALTSGHKLLCCGNGGSAADCAHLTTEIAGRYKCDRRGFCAIDLTANHSLTTALINDFAPVEVFARQVEALGAPGDVLLIISTSGRSKNVHNALEAARQKKLGTVALLGRDGGICKQMADVELIVPEDCVPRIQEAHILLYHTICDVLDPVLARSRK